MLPRCNWRQLLVVKVQTTDYSQKIQLLKLNLLEVPSGKVESDSTMATLLMLHQLVGGNTGSG